MMWNMIGLLSTTTGSEEKFKSVGMKYPDEFVQGLWSLTKYFVKKGPLPSDYANPSYSPLMVVEFYDSQLKDVLKTSEEQVYP